MEFFYKTGLTFQLNEVNMKIEKANNEAARRLQTMAGDSTNRLNSLDTKTRALVEELFQQLADAKASAEVERDKMEQRLLSHMNRQQEEFSLQMVRTAT